MFCSENSVFPRHYIPPTTLYTAASGSVVLYSRHTSLIKHIPIIVKGNPRPVTARMRGVFPVPVEVRMESGWLAVCVVARCSKEQANLLLLLLASSCS